MAKALASHRKLIGLSDELIVVDGGSKDGTLRVIEENSDIVQKFVSEEDISEGHAVNKGVLLASGKYIKLLTDDDYFYREAIEKAVRIMEKNPQVDILLAGGTKHHGGQVGYVYVPSNISYGKSIDNIFKYGACGLGLVIRRSVFSRIGLFNPRAVAMDVDFLAKAIHLGARVKFCRLNMYLHKIEEHSAVASYNEKLFQDFNRIKKQYGVKDDLLLNLRVQLSQLVFAKLPKSFQKFYLKSFKKESGKSPKIKPVWDGGLS